MLVGELHQVLMEHQITCHRTCFSLRLGDVPLDSHTKLCSIQDGAVIKVEEGNCLTLFHTFFHPSCLRLLFTASDPSFMIKCIIKNYFDNHFIHTLNHHITMYVNCAYLSLHLGFVQY